MEASVASAGGGGGPVRRNRGRGNKRNKRGTKVTNAQSKGPSVPPPPQLKIALRHIGNPSEYGTTKSVLEKLVIPMVEACNVKALTGTPSSSPIGLINASTSVTTNSAFFLELDHASKIHLINEEEAAQSFLKEWESQQKKDQNGIEKDYENGEDEKLGATNEAANDSEQHNKMADSPDVVVAPTSKPPPNIPFISFRPLYVNPPKKTRRRGDRPGVAYILLTAPKIEKVDIPETVPEHGIPKVVAPPIGQEPQTTDGVVNQAKQAGRNIVNVSYNESRPVGPTEVPSDAKSLVSKGDAISSVAPSVKKSVDYSRQVAQGRLLLQNVVAALQELTNRHEGKGPSPGTVSFPVQVETAMSGKTWRWQNNRPDRRENTLESTADYKNWLAAVEKQQADLKARPKPAPGGGLATEENGVPNATGNTTGQPLAALVQHLRAKQEELKRKNKAKKKKDATTPGGGGVKDNKKGSKSGKNSKRPKAGSKSDGNAANKKKQSKRVGRNKNPRSVAPSAVLKS